MMSTGSYCSIQVLAILEINSHNISVKWHYSCSHFTEKTEAEDGELAQNHTSGSRPRTSESMLLNSQFYWISVAYWRFSKLIR